MQFFVAKGNKSGFLTIKIWVECKNLDIFKCQCIIYIYIYVYLCINKKEITPTYKN